MSAQLRLPRRPGPRRPLAGRWFEVLCVLVLALLSDRADTRAPADADGLRLEQAWSRGPGAGSDARRLGPESRDASTSASARAEVDEESEVEVGIRPNPATARLQRWTAGLVEGRVAPSAGPELSAGAPRGPPRA